MLALLAATACYRCRGANAAKNVLNGLANAAAAVAFAWFGPVNWAVVPLAAGFLVAARRPWCSEACRCCASVAAAGLAIE
jgi:hypothetical protein